MQDWQEKYIENARRIAESLAGAGTANRAGADERALSQAEAAKLRQENISILNTKFFPAIGSVMDCSQEEREELIAFGDALMDWNSNLDVGVYVLIHDALLKMYRARGSRNDLIRELYRLGMGVYYLRRSVEFVDNDETAELARENGSLFEEAASYIDSYDEIDDEETRGYIVRAFANIALCTGDHKKKIAASAKAIEIIKDEHYRALAPGLPWDVYLRRAHQQMSANRSELSRGDLSPEEIKVLLESCQEVFTPETRSGEPNPRWLWPYYDMEYSLGRADLDTTMDRLEQLIDAAPADKYDMAGMYANVQLAVCYGKLVETRPELQADPARTAYLRGCYEKMSRALSGDIPEDLGDFADYLIGLALTEYFEMPGVSRYDIFAKDMLRRHDPELYAKGRRTGLMMREISAAMLANDPRAFDGVPYAGWVPDAGVRNSGLLDLAEGCGLYHDIGLLKMDFGRRLKTRSLFSAESMMFALHARAGAADLRKRASTERYADCALGHHAFYNGQGGYPETYDRGASACRVLTDICAAADFMSEYHSANVRRTFDLVYERSGRQFSPDVCSLLRSDELRSRIGSILEMSDAQLIPDQPC